MKNKVSSWMFFTLLCAGPSPFLQPALHGQQPGEQSYQDDSNLPEGIEGVRIEALIEAVNSGDPASIQQFLEEHVTSEFRDGFPLEDHLNAFGAAKRQWGSVTFHGIRTYTPAREGETIVILRDSNFDAWCAFSLEFNGSDSRIAGLGFNSARTPTNVAQPAPLAEQELVPEIERLLRRVCDRDVFSGTVLVAQGDQILATHACGEASKRFHVANNLETRFNLGSMNKMFTATAVMQLVERGLVGLDDPIGTYVDDSWLPAEITEQVTVHHLLTHTSGLGSYFNRTFMESSRARFRQLDDFKPLVNGDTLAFEPGSQYSYSNTGMLLLGVVIETATGEDYFDYIRDNIYHPAGMERSDSYEMDQPVENLAIGYDPAPNSPWGFENNLFKHVIKGGPAGGGFSTVGDLHRFALALQSGALVSQASMDRMWRDHSGTGYGYGFGVQDGPNGRVVGHSGGFPGINANLDVMLDRGYIVAVMSNYGGAASPVASRISELIARVPRAAL